MNALPAVSHGTIYLRTDRSLWCIARAGPNKVTQPKN